MSCETLNQVLFVMKAIVLKYIRLPKADEFIPSLDEVETLYRLGI